MAKQGVVLEEMLFEGDAASALSIWENWTIASPARYVCFSNVHMSIEAFDHSDFFSIVESASMVCADGQPLVWASRFLLKKKLTRLSGMDMLPLMLDRAEQNGIRCFFVGGSHEAEQKTQLKLKQRWPKLLFATYSPPFEFWSEEEKLHQRKLIQEFHAQWTFVILGCPKQERWMKENSPFLSGVLFGVGGAMPVLLGMQNRAPKWMQRSGLEWVFRLIQEPRRMWKRYLYTNLKYLFLLLRSTL